MLLRALLMAAVVVSAVTVVWSTHAYRGLVSEVEVLRAKQHQLDVEFGQLQLEEASLAHPGRIDEAARSELGMQLPDNRTVVEARP
ncbi:cell division protein FtsL [Algiphilus sp.]|uniref:cell division protein FtsL n=1 Tax=Algiphilus sp. TaxID=1872431 RepID=UPI0025BEA5FA|nr:cell division protein FtsL [Algiphilus sp.]